MKNPRTEDEARARLASSINELAGALAEGRVSPVPEELDVLAAICEEKGLPEEAARIRGWLETPAQTRSNAFAEGDPD